MSGVPNRVVWIENLAIAAVILTVVVVLGMIFFYKPS